MWFETLPLVIFAQGLSIGLARTRRHTLQHQALPYPALPPPCAVTASDLPCGLKGLPVCSGPSLTGVSPGEALASLLQCDICFLEDPNWHSEDLDMGREKGMEHEGMSYRNTV